MISLIVCCDGICACDPTFHGSLTPFPLSQITMLKNSPTPHSLFSQKKIEMKVKGKGKGKGKI